MSKTILYLVGYGGSGKSSAAQYLQQKYGFVPFSFSAAIRDYAAEHNIALRSRLDYARTHAEMLSKNGWDYTLNLALQLPHDRICIDDVRSPKYADRIKQAGGMSIAFDCPPEVRFAHTQTHADKAKYPATFETFLQNERDDDATVIAPGLEFNIEQLLESADYHIDATGTLENTLEQLNSIIDRIVYHPRGSEG